MPDVTMRFATADDIPLLEAWDEQPHVIASTDEEDKDPWADELARDRAWAWTFIGEEDGRPFGVVQVIDPHLEDTHYWGDVEPDLRALDIWIGPPEDLDRGLGTELMTLALDFCFAAPAVTAVIIDPLERNTAARRFYERIGFREEGPRRFGNADCVVYRIERAEWVGRSR